ncbi:MAG: acyl-CoA dehydrogenase family protein [Oscillospiraceae bacterium]|nr:acyl-CoA dehydrogenase family protein [Oscillospiraceae bacterium]
MNYNFTSDQLSLRDMTRNFVEQEVMPIAAEYDVKGEFPMEAFKKAADLGLTCLDLPEEWGGAGVDLLTTALIREELSRGDAGFSSAVGACGLGFKPIAFGGSDYQKRKYADVVTGGGLLALGLTEPNAGSDVANNKTTAVKQGDKYVLNGRKCFITNAPVADIITIFAITDPEAGAKGFSMFMVEKGTPGLSTPNHENKMGIRCSTTSDVVLEDCVIPAENLIGREGDGFKLVMATLAKGRVCAGASALGVAQCALEHALKYAQQRIQKGKPIYKHQLIQGKIADMGMQLEAARQLVWRAAMAFDANAADTDKLASMCKCFAGDMVVKVTSEAIQILGGYGYSRDYPVEKLYRDAKVFQLFEGTNEIQRTIIAGSMIREYKI